MKTEHTLHYETAAEAQAAARILARQSAMIQVTVLQDGKSVRVSYDTPLFTLLRDVLDSLHKALDWLRHLRAKPSIAHA